MTMRTLYDVWCDEAPDDEWIEKIATAFHEAGHAVVGHVLGRTPVAVSIRPSDHYSGVAVYDVQTTAGHPDHPEGSDVAIDMPCRAWIERRIVITKAGTETEALLYDIPVERVDRPAPDVQAEARFQASLASLGGRAVELLRAAAHTPGPDDWTQAKHLGAHLAGSEASAHGYWMSAITRRLVVENWPAVEAIARALLHEEVISGDRVVEICERSVLGER